MPGNEAEAARDHARCIAGIEKLGGWVTTEKWAPAWADELAYESNQRLWATNPDPPEINDADSRVKALLDEGPSLEFLWMMDNDFPPAHHAWKAGRVRCVDSLTETQEENHYV